MKNIYFALALATLSLSLNSAEIPTKRTHIDEERAEIAKKVNIATLTELCMAKVYPYLDLETLFPEILEKFHAQLNSTSGFAQLSPLEQTNIIKELSYTKKNEFGDIQITLNQLYIGIGGFSSQLPTLKPFFKKIIRGLIAKNTLFSDWIWSNDENSLCKSTPENIDEKLKLFATLPYSVQEYIQEELVFSQKLQIATHKPAKRTFKTAIVSQSVPKSTEQSYDWFAQDENYTLLTSPNPESLHVQILDEDLELIADLPNKTKYLQKCILVDDIFYFFSDSVFFEGIASLNFTEKKYYDVEASDTGEIYSTYLTENNLLFAATKLPNRKYGILCWDLKNKTLLHRIISLTREIFPFFHENNQLYVYNKGGKFFRIDLATGQMVPWGAIIDKEILYYEWKPFEPTGFIHNNVMYAKAHHFLTIKELHPDGRGTGKVIATIPHFAVQRKDHLLYIVSPETFYVWDINQKKQVHTIKAPQGHFFSQFITDKDFIYLISEYNKQTMILDRHTYALVAITTHPRMNEHHTCRYLAYGDTILAAALYRLKKIPLENIDKRLEIIDALTGNVKMALHGLTSTIIDIQAKSADNSLYTLDQAGVITAWYLSLRSWKSVLYQKMLGAANTIEDLKKLQKRLDETYFVRQLSEQELAEIAEEIESRKKQLEQRISQNQ